MTQNTQDQRRLRRPLHPLVIFFERRSSMLEEGDIIELKEGMRVYAEVPEHFLYTNRRGVFDKTAHGEIEIAGHLGHFAGR